MFAPVVDQGPADVHSSKSTATRLRLDNYSIVLNVSVFRVKDSRYLIAATETNMK